MTADDSDPIRRARPDEAERLTDLAMRSKAHWGYSDAFMMACRAELAVTPARIAREILFVYDAGDGPEGTCELSIDGDEAEVGLMFVAPASMGKGIGAALWRHMEAEAIRHGVRRLTIASDPGAEGFYRAMGARTIGRVPSESIPGRTLPHMEKILGRAPE
jgi:GNAT superfamily N-acetyltransferase